MERRYAQTIIESYERSDDPKVWVRLGHLLAEMGEWEKATHSFSRAIEQGAPADVRRHLVLTHLAQGETKEAALARAELLLGLTSPSRAAARAETQIRIQEALNSMEPIDREILALRHFEELSNNETAEGLGLSKAAASNRYIRALKRLRKILRPHLNLYGTTHRPEPS